MGCRLSNAVDVPAAPHIDRVQYGTTDNNSQPTVLDSENTLFQYSSQTTESNQSPKRAWNRPPPATLRTTVFIANELQHYPGSSIDNIWSDGQGGSGHMLPPPPSTLGPSTNIWAIQSTCAPGLPDGTSNIWGVDLAEESVGSGDEHLWRYAVDDPSSSSMASDAMSRNVWSQSGHLTDSGVSSDFPPSSLLALPRTTGLTAIDERDQHPLVAVK